MTKRKDLWLIVSSATLNAEMFSEYFNNAQVIRVPGWRFEVEIFYTKEPERDYVESCVVTVLQIHAT